MGCQPQLSSPVVSGLQGNQLPVEGLIQIYPGDSGPSSRATPWGCPGGQGRQVPLEPED